MNSRCIALGIDPVAMVLAVTVFACEGSDSAEVNETTVMVASMIDIK